MTVKYPQITVEDFGRDGNAIALMGQVADALRSGGVGAELVAAFYAEAKSGDYAHLLQTCGAWVNLAFWDDEDVDESVFWSDEDEGGES